jgi:putative membrane protein
MVTVSCIANWQERQGWVEGGRPGLAARSASAGRIPTNRAGTLNAANVGLTLAVYLIIRAGAGDVAHAMLLVGWGLVPVSLFHLAPLGLSALSWRDLLPAGKGPGLWSVILIRWLRESINGLLPVAGVGGDLIGTRLIHHAGVPGRSAAASTIVDLTVGLLTQLLFVVSGLVLLVSISRKPAVLATAGAVLAGIVLFAIAMTVFLALQHRGMFEVSTRVAGGLLRNRRLAEFAGKAADIDATVVAIYRERARFWRALALRYLGWAAGAGEVWLIMYFFGQPLSLADAFILESLGAGVRAVAFIIPGAVGVLEGSFVVFGGLFGLPPQTSLMIALCRRARELALGIPGLAAWQMMEGHRLMRRRRT